MFTSSVATEMLRIVVEGMRSFAAADDSSGAVDQLVLLEELKSAVCAAQAEIAAGLVGEPAGAEHPPAVLRSVGAEVGLARRESPHRGRGLVGLGIALVNDLPHTLAALRAGLINERRAMIVVTESSDLDHADRLTLDVELAGKLATMGDRETQLASQRIALRLDQAGALARRERALRRRAVSGRRLRDGMAQITAVVPDTAYHEIMNSLEAQARRDRAAGERALVTMATQPGHTVDAAAKAGRSHTQLMADAFVARLTGASTPTGVHLNLVMSAETLLGLDDEPADVVGRGGLCGPIPADLARKLISSALVTPGARASLRRLFTLAETDTLVSMDATTRTFDGALAEFIRLRDQVCRTPWCNGQVQHHDHITPHAQGGPTSADNGEGLCAACNYTKEHLGWRHAANPGLEHVVDITTPTGRRYRSRAPAQPFTAGLLTGEIYSPAETILLDRLWAS